MPVPRAVQKLVADHREYVDILRALRALPGVKKVFVRSGVRFDYALADKSGAFLQELVQHHISGQLKVAPEHISPRVLRCMGKPTLEVYDRFVKRFHQLNRECGLRQYLVPYLMSSHPGCELADAVLLAEYLHRTGQRPEQVQDFYPTPGTLSTAMFYTGLDPRDMTPVYVPRDPHEKAMQRALMQYFRPENHALVLEALRRAGREDLIGFGKACLIPPRPIKAREKGEKARPAVKQSGGKKPSAKKSIRKGGEGQKKGPARAQGKRPPERAPRHLFPRRQAAGKMTALPEIGANAKSLFQGRSGLRITRACPRAANALVCAPALHGEALPAIPEPPLAAEAPGCRTAAKPLF